MAHWGDRLCTILKIRGFQKPYAIAHALGVNERTENVAIWENGILTEGANEDDKKNICLTGPRNS